MASRGFVGFAVLLLFGCQSKGKPSADVEPSADVVASADVEASAAQAQAPSEPWDDKWTDDERTWAAPGYGLAGVGNTGMALPFDKGISQEDADRYHDAALGVAIRLPPKREVITVDGVELAMSKWTTPLLMISERCLADDGRRFGKCDALGGLRHVATRNAEEADSVGHCELSGGASTENGDYCKFPDGSFISPLSLTYVPRFGYMMVHGKAPKP